jgi:hypothetical protein
MEQETHEIYALTTALWWAREHLTYNVSFNDWELYCASLDYNLDFWLA